MTDGIVSDTGIPNEGEQMVPQSKVNEVVGREKALVEQRVKRELEAKYMQEIEAMKQSQQGAASGVDENAIAERIQAQLMQKMEEQRLEQQKQEYVQYLDNVAGNYLEKMKAGPSLYEDFQETVADFEPKEFKDVLFLAHDMPELPGIIYELSKNSNKLVELDALAQKSPKMAKKRLQQLADSIRKNEEAKQQAQSSTTNAPLQSIKPSSAAGVGDGKMSLKDLKKASWLKG